MDKPGASVNLCVTSIREKLKAPPLLLQVNDAALFFHFRILPFASLLHVMTTWYPEIIGIQDQFC